MSFTTYKTVDALRADYPLAEWRERFLEDRRLDVPDALRENFEFSLSVRKTNLAEAFYVENFVYPVLLLAWKRHRRLFVWPRREVVADNRLVGLPDYLVSDDRPIVSRVALSLPLMAVIEAKRQDFDEGWGQCLTAMLASQMLNNNPALTVYGIVSTGLGWEFGKLEGDRFTRHTLTYGISDLPLVLGMVDQVFELCERQLPPA